MKLHMLSYLPETDVSAVTGRSGAVMIPFRATRKSGLLLVLALAVMTLGVVKPSYGQNVINCPSGFASSGACKVVSGGGSGGPNFSILEGLGSLSGSGVLLMPTGESHMVSALNWQQAVNVQAFTASFTFVPNGQNISFVLNNNTNTQSGPAGAAFSSGAGCEAGFYQAYDSATPPYPNNVFALELDSQSELTLNSSFTYSSTQIYKTGDSPCLPNDGGPDYTPINKISTSPVPLDSPVASQATTTGDTYSATITYDGSNVTLNLYDVTAGAACPGTSCFTYTWNNVNIPSIVGSSTAYVGFTTATGLTSQYPLYVDSFSYTVGSLGQKPAAPTGLQGTMVSR